MWGDFATGDDDDAGSVVAKLGDVTFTTGATGVPFFDAGPLGKNVVDGAVPTWETIMLVYSRAFPTDERKVWTGLVSLDAEGYVVWYTQYGGALSTTELTISPFTQTGALDDYSVVYGVWFGGQSGFPTYVDDKKAALYSQLIQVDAFGAVQAEAQTDCSRSGRARARDPGRKIIR